MKRNSWKTNLNQTKKKKHDSSILTSETGENVYPFVFILSLRVCICVQYFFDTLGNQTLNKVTRVNQKKIMEIKSSCKAYVR